MQGVPTWAGQPRSGSVQAITRQPLYPPPGSIAEAEGEDPSRLQEYPYVPRLVHVFRHTFVTTMLDAGVDLRDVQIAARHADPRTTMRYDRARKNLDCHPNYILAAYMASGT